jgi:hypothetical protein
MGVLNTSCPCKLAILSVFLNYWGLFLFYFFITKDVWSKAEEHVVKIEKEYCKENCTDRSAIEPIIIDFCDDDSDDDTG